MNQRIEHCNDELIIKLSNDGRHLQAVFSTSAKRTPIKLDWLKRKINDMGYSQIALNNDALDHCIEQFNAGTKKSLINIGDCKDGEFTLTISDDNLTASINYCTPCGGKPFRRQDIYKTLKEHGIKIGVLEEEINKVLQLQQAPQETNQDTPQHIRRAVIAEGIKAVNGGDAYFESLIPDAKDRSPHINDHLQAHHSEACHLIMVNPGDKIARLFPTTPGKPGKNIKGEEIPPTPGQHILPEFELKGTRWDSEDQNILTATITGQPIITPSMAMVEATISVDQVDIKTGNIDYDGTVIINGDITTGMSVTATGDIYIHGMVQEATSINAGGDIIVSKGVIGRGALFDENGMECKGAARLVAGARITARFIENAFVYAGDYLKVEELITHSDITTKNHVIVGKEDAKHGHIMGGTTRATLMVQAKVLGSPAAVHTKVIVGVNPDLTKQLNDINERYQQKMEEHKKLELAYAKISKNIKKDKEKSRAIIKKIQDTNMTLNTEMTDLRNRQQVLTTEIERLANASITVKHKVYCAVEATIGTSTYKLDEEKNAGTFQLRQNKIVFNYG